MLADRGPHVCRTAAMAGGESRPSVMALPRGTPPSAG
jgi:hypothetical protein